jgi:hypothetical protein
MTEFSREQLCQVLAETDATPHKKILALCQDSMETWTQCAAERMARSLPAIAHRHRVRRAQQPAIQKAAIERLQTVRDGLDAALRALDAAVPSLGDLLGYSLEPSTHSGWGKRSATVHEQIETMRELRNNVESTRLAFAYNGPSGTRDIQIQTYLYFDVSALYYELTGNDKIGDDKKGGPLYRFAKQCIALIDPDLIPTVYAFRKALQRQRKETMKNVGHLLG